MQNELGVTEMLAIRGNFDNGNIQAGEGLLLRIAQALELDRTASSVFAEGQYHTLGNMENRMTELSDAIIRRDARQWEKAFALIVSLISFLNGEHLPEGLTE